MKQKITWNGDVIQIAYEGLEPFIGDCAELPEGIYRPCAAARHGIAQKLGDAASGKPVSEKRAEVLEIWDSLKAGEWNRRPGRGPGAGLPDEETLAQAFAFMARTRGLHGKQAEKAIAAWQSRYAALTVDEQKALCAGMLKPALDAVRAERRLAGQQADFFNLD